MPSQLSKFGDNDDDGDDELSRVVVKPVVVVMVYQNSSFCNFGDRDNVGAGRGEQGRGKQGAGS